MPTKPASGTALNTGHSLAVGMLHFWAMLEGSGTTTADSKGGMTGTFVGSPSWTTDAEGPLITGMTAGNNVITSAAASGFTDPLVMTMAFRVTLPNISTGRFSPFAMDNGSGAMPFFEFGDINGLANAFHVLIPGTIVAEAAIGAYSVDDAATFAYVRNGAGDTHVFYRDGSALTKTATGNESTSYSNGSDKRLMGDRSDAATQPWTKRMAWVAVWNRALSAGEVSSFTTDPFQVFGSGGLPFITQLGAQRI